MIKISLSIAVLCIAAGCHSAPPLQPAQFNPTQTAPSVTAPPATEASAIQFDANGRVVRRQWAVSVAPYPRGSVYAYPTFFQTADNSFNRPAWEEPFYEPGMFLYDLVTYPYHIFRTPPRSEVEYHGAIYTAADASPSPR